jgi:hypothetical protein
MAVSAHIKGWLSAGIIAALRAGATTAGPAAADTRVTWREIDPSEYARPGTFVVTGTVEGTSLQACATVTVKEESS